MAMSNSYMQIKQPPWRYILTAAAFLATFIVLLATYRHSAALQNIASKAKPSQPSEPSPSVPLVDHVLNTTLGFEKVFAISLPERTDRRDGLILASALSGIDITFVDGVHGDSVLEKALPPGDHKNLASSSVGSWRAHLNAIARVVHENHATALIIEDDVDWDVRLKSLLRDFALSSNALAQHAGSGTIDFDNMPPTMSPTVSPYGDDWDLLWLGHCGMHLPATGLVIHYNDASVPEPQYLQSWDKNERTPLMAYPAHTRAVMRDSTLPVCSLGYALSQQGARKLLYSLGLQKFDAPFDVMLRSWCQGVEVICPGVLPQLFDHYRRQGPKNLDSDISDPNEGYRDKPVTLNIRWSVRINAEKILRGETSLDDQYPDTQ